MTELNNTSICLYLRIYNYYKDLIVTGQLSPGDRLPSVRQCSQQLQISRTTAETAYLLLAADGYIISRPQSGYYVTAAMENKRKKEENKPETAEKKENNPAVRFDFSSAAADSESFNFSIWRRYIKSALRQDERLLSYGEPQGERELREVLADYCSRHRNVLCRPDDIVIGAGVQSLLNILCPLLKDADTVSFPTPSFRQGIQIFDDHGFEIHYRDKNASVIYVSPSHMNGWGEVMTVRRRLELLRHASGKSLIIEDDYESEFQYMHRPIPSLQSLAGGTGVVYIGTFSRLLLPSIRLSYMVLPPELSDIYAARAAGYNQTASKTEQIALCQFIRDGHLEAQSRKLRRLYDGKTKQICSALKDMISESKEKLSGITVEEGSLCAVITVDRKPGKPSGYPVTDSRCERIKKEAAECGIGFDSVLKDNTGTLKIVLSSFGIKASEIKDGCRQVLDFLEDARRKGLFAEQ